MSILTDRALAAALTLTLAAASAGCATTKRRTPSTGPQVFAAACRACHTLVGNESGHTMGGDLLGYHASRADLLSFVREMPVPVRLSAAQLQAVTDYVYAAEQRSAGAAGATGAAR